MSSYDLIPRQTINSDGFNSIKFEDVDLFLNSKTLPRAFEPMSSPSHKAEERTSEKKEPNGKQSTTTQRTNCSESFEQQVNTLQQPLISEKRSQIQEQVQSSSHFKSPAPFLKTQPCNWAIKGSYRSQLGKRQRLESMLKQVSLKEQICKNLSSVEASPEQIKWPRQQMTLSFEEQSDMNLFKLASRRTSQKQLSITCLKAFDELHKKQDHHKFIRTFVKKRPLGGGNAHPYDRQVYQISQKTSSMQQYPHKQELVSHNQMHYQNFICKRADFKQTRRHKKIIEKAEQLQEEEYKRAIQKKKSSFLYLLRCHSQLRHPLAVALRLAKFSLNQQRSEDIEHARIVSDLHSQNLKKSVRCDQNVQEADEEVVEQREFEYEVLRDKNEFAELLDFYFERRMLCQGQQEEQWCEYLHPKNSSLIPNLERIERQAKACIQQQINIRKALKKNLHPDIFDKLIRYQNKLRSQVRDINRRSKVRILGNYIGDRMIGITHIPKFDVLINGNLHTVKIKERKGKEKDMFKVYDEYTDKLFLSELKTHQLELLVEATWKIEAMQRIEEFQFFLQELTDPEEIINACIKVVSGEFSIYSTIGIPDIKEHLAHVAFRKVMTRQDLSKFTFSSDELEICVNVPLSNIKAFVLKLAEYKRKKRERDQEGGSSLIERSEGIDIDKDRSNSGCDKFNYVQQQISKYYSTVAKSTSTKQNKKTKENEEQECIIQLGSRIAPRQDSIDFLTFNEDSV